MLNHNKFSSPSSRSAFSLVELSIVLVILGLLVGGILSGRSLIRASELRAVGTEYGRWVTATHTFRDKYFGLPGDLATATMIWGKDNVKCTGDTGTTTVPGTCNGNGNGNINFNSATTGDTGEMFQYWKQLALAGLIEGTYTGVNGGDADTVIIGTNGPMSKVNQAGWAAVHGTGVVALGVSYFSVSYASNLLLFGQATANDIPATAAIAPEEAWNIDTKMDDGKPGRGRIIGARWSTCTNASGNTDIDTTYKLTDPSIACTLVFFPQF
ncbi:MAG: prepilin-type N-terminal cleavage/methylation domain-containing protein [Pseudomonadota bacterium]